MPINFVSFQKMRVALCGVKKVRNSKKSEKKWKNYFEEKRNRLFACVSLLVCLCVCVCQS